jgi:hypothetical protein
LESVVLTALDVELVEVALLLAPMPEVRAFVGGVRTAADGVYATELVVAFDPAEEDPDDA